jgi:hypothetical protein
MATLIFTFALLFQTAAAMQVAGSVELRCLGFMSAAPVPHDLFISGTYEEGISALGHQGTIVYLGGPGLANLKPGANYAVIRLKGEIRLGEEETTNLYSELGTVRIESVDAASAAAFVVVSCQPFHKGDLVVPPVERKTVEFHGSLSNRLTPFPDDSLVSTILMGQDDLRELADGHFCFIGVGEREGVKTGDRFTVYRHAPPFDRKDVNVAGQGRSRDYRMWRPDQDSALMESLKGRGLPPRPLGDIVVVDVGSTTATGRIVNSLAEIHPGDIVARRQ